MGVLDHSAKLYKWIKCEDHINMSGLRFSGAQGIDAARTLSGESGEKEPPQPTMMRFVMPRAVSVDICW